MLCLTKQLQARGSFLRRAACQLQSTRTEASPSRRRPKSPPLSLKKMEDKSEWWTIDGEMHEIGDHVPPRERFVIPRENIPNKRRKQLREQFMRRTRLVLKESSLECGNVLVLIGRNSVDVSSEEKQEHEPWCKKYMELYQELRENWERLYWDEGYSMKIAQDHANYESAEDDDEDFSPYRSRRPQVEHSKEQSFVRNRQGDTWDKVNFIRDKFEYDRERRMRQKAFAPMHGEPVFESHEPNSSRNQLLNADRYFGQRERE